MKAPYPLRHGFQMKNQDIVFDGFQIRDFTGSINIVDDLRPLNLILLLQACFFLTFERSVFFFSLYFGD